MSVRYFVYAFAVLTAIAANIPFSKLYFKTDPETRRSEVLSEFINVKLNSHLTSRFADVRIATAHKNSDILVQHLHPGVAKEISDYLNMSVSDYRRMLAEPEFEAEFALMHRSIVFEDIQFGSGTRWDWALVPVRSSVLVQESRGEPSCGIWLIFWRDDDWFTSNVSNTKLHDMIVRAIPEFADIPFSNLPNCATAPAE